MALRGMARRVSAGQARPRGAIGPLRGLAGPIGGKEISWGLEKSEIDMVSFCLWHLSHSRYATPFSGLCWVIHRRRPMRHISSEIIASSSFGRADSARAARSSQARAHAGRIPDLIRSGHPVRLGLELLPGSGHVAHRGVDACGDPDRRGRPPCSAGKSAATCAHVSPPNERRRRGKRLGRYALARAVRA